MSDEIECKAQHIKFKTDGSMAKPASKNFWKILFIISCGSLMVIVKGYCASSGDNNVKNFALHYLSGLDQGMEIFVWPSYLRPYEIVDGNSEIAESISRYNVDHRSILQMFEAPVVAQISVISINYDTFSRDAEKLLKNSKLLQAYKSYASKASLNSDGCTAYKFIDRNTWVSVGLIFVDRTKFGIGNKTYTDSCLHGALDYVNGFPVKGNYFEYISLPLEPVRRIILEKLYYCSSIDDNKSRLEETTKDGITPLPSIECITAKLKQ
ncbi:MULTISPECIES: hypothetical protein [unclassified Mesorhizobium]|uniref:hypothetical protein n=1 Tax=unclassified Mesorhizobium TaxID=325217 RepID=UPI003335E72E